jgi:tight adherence protein C
MAVILLITSVYLFLYQFRSKLFGIEEIHLPTQIFDKSKTEIKLISDIRQSGSRWLFGGNSKGQEREIPFPLPGLKKRLIKAGSPMGELQFLVFKVLSIIFVPVASFIILGNKFSPNVVLIVSLAIGFLLPEIWLNNKIKRRQARIVRDLPNIIDLLNLCVSGGLDFMLAVNRVVKDLKPCDLTRELAEVYRETQIGKPKREALKNFAWRVDIPEVHSFVRTLIQADRMGTPMAEALNLQAEEIRVRRFQKGEAMALKAPIKLLFPLFVFILPVVLIIVGAPILLQFVRGGMNFGFW